MNGEILLDTNIVVAIFEDDPAVRQGLAKRPRVRIPMTVLGELYYGAFKSAKQDENFQRINDLLSQTPLLQYDAGTAYEYGSIRNELRLKGRPIPENDIWVAAVARQHDLTLVSRDTHFAHVDGLKLEHW
jgi:tRNA(fMet)-specific endonuclease VapC